MSNGNAITLPEAREEAEFRFKYAQRVVRLYFEEHARAPRIAHPNGKHCACKLCQQAWKVLVDDPAVDMLNKGVKP